MEEFIKIADDNLCVDTEELRKIIVDDWQVGKFYRHYYNYGYRGEILYWSILDELEDYMDAITYTMAKNARIKLGRPNAPLDWCFDRHPKSDVRSIGFEIVDKLSSASDPIENLTLDDIPAILEFLDTPPGKSLEAWDKWEKYWGSLDYPARLKKLMDDERYI